MKYFSWDEEKNEKLKMERDISFEEVQAVLNSDQLLDTVRNPSTKYPNQRMFVVKINNYVYLVPFVEDDEKIFLKTVIPSRKATKKYLIERR